MNELKEKHYLAVIVYSALIFSVFIMAGVVFIFNLLGITLGFINFFGNEKIIFLARSAFYFLGLSLLYASKFSDAKLLKAKFPSQEELLKALFTSSLIKAALGETCALLGFILFILTGSFWDFILLFTAALLFQIYNFPRKSAWQDFINAVKTQAVHPS